MKRRNLIALAGAVLLLGTSCSSSDETTTDLADGPAAGSGSTTAAPDGQDGDGHGAVEGAQEVAEPQLHLVSVDRSGKAALLDLLSGDTTDVGTVPGPSALASDGRYALATVDGGVAVIDSGVWTWNHGDHFHYYRSAPEVVGTVPGRGEATVSTGLRSTAGGTGIFFPRTGEAVLLDNSALSDGELTESFRTKTTPHDGLVAPFAGGAVVTVPDASGSVTHVELVDGDGEPVAGTRTRCADARGDITTTVGLVIGCADGALLWTESEDEHDVERIPYPADAAAPPATAFAARKSRPTVAALAGPTGFWLLDTRERSWRLHDAGVRLRHVAAVDDADGHVVALDAAGRVRVYAADTGKQLGATRPLVRTGPRAGGARGEVTLVVDQERAYVNAPAEGMVHEIDYADGARLARELPTATEPAFFTETGR